MADTDAKLDSILTKIDAMRITASGQRTASVLKTLDQTFKDADTVRKGVDLNHKGAAPPAGPTFCNKGTSDRMGGCIGENGKSLDPSTGKPTGGSN